MLDPTLQERLFAVHTSGELSAANPLDHSGATLLGLCFGVPWLLAVCSGCVHTSRLSSVDCARHMAMLPTTTMCWSAGVHMVRLPWLPVLAQYLREQASYADTSHTRVPQLPPPLLDVLHTSKLGLKGGRTPCTHGTSPLNAAEAPAAISPDAAAFASCAALVSMQQHDWPASWNRR